MNILMLKIGYIRKKVEFWGLWLKLFDCLYGTNIALFLRLFKLL